MAAVTNNKVIEAWQSGKPAANHTGTLKCYSDGTLYSYGLHIGRRTPSVSDYLLPCRTRQARPGRHCDAPAGVGRFPVE